jgi:hypothetical protein
MGARYKESYGLHRSQAKGVQDAMTDGCFARYCGSWTPALRGETCPKEEFGPNSTVHGRYRKWCKEGLWSRIVEALGDDGAMNRKKIEVAL